VQQRAAVQPRPGKPAVLNTPNNAAAVAILQPAACIPHLPGALLLVPLPLLVLATTSSVVLVRTHAGLDRAR
jgi:hypothetical protein